MNAAVPPTSPAADTESVAAAAAAPLSPRTQPAARCENCGAAITGRYCASCGQRVEPPVHSLWHFTQAATEDLTHADSRVWRTLAALLFKPGRLTREFLRGRRASYLPPVRLYLVLSVAFFLWASATQSRIEVLQVRMPDKGGATAKVVTLADATKTPLPGESSEQHAAHTCEGVNYDGPWRERLQPAAHRACLRIVADQGRSLRESFLHNVPRAMFAFLPLLAGAMMLMYWRPRHYYVEHLLLLVHAHAFVFLALMVGWALAKALPFASGWITFALTLYIPWYMFRSMRVVYGQGRWLTGTKLVALSFFYLMSGAVMLGLTTVYSALTL
ncbi:MAG: DUF3667 domain-containing protein [Gammaproteobacteria bacterium]|nr:DUF3667 domain-containing protein [Gammaproteobacteria bacterium]